MDLWNATGNEDNRFIGVGDGLGMTFNKALVWTHLINSVFFFKRCTCSVQTFGKLMESPH